MKQLITVGLISATLIAGSPVHDLMDNRIKGKSYTGSLDDNTAAEDGLGILPLSSYSMTTDVANELLVQKVLSKIEKSETDKTKTVNIKDGLTAGTVGTVADLTLFNKYVSASTGSSTLGQTISDFATKYNALGYGDRSMNGNQISVTHGRDLANGGVSIPFSNMESGKKYYFELETIAGTGYHIRFNNKWVSYSSGMNSWERIGILLDFQNNMWYHVRNGVIYYAGDSRWQSTSITPLTGQNNVISFDRYNSSGHLYNVFFNPSEWTSVGALSSSVTALEIANP